MNRVEFQRWLDQFPEDTEIEVMMQEPEESWYAASMISRVFDENNEDHFNYVDFTGNQYVKEGDDYYNKRLLTLGGKE